MIKSPALVTTLSPAPDPVQRYYHRHALIMAKYEDRYGLHSDTINMPSGSGKVAMMRRWTHLPPVISPLAEATPPQGKNPAYTDYSATLYQWGDFIVTSDVVSVTDVDDHGRIWADLLGQQAGYTEDMVNRDAMCAGLQVIRTNGTLISDVNTIINAGHLDKAILQLQNNGAQTILGGGKGSPNYGSTSTMPCYVAIVMPDVLNDLQAIPDFFYADKYANAAPGEIGRYRQIAFFLAPDPASLGAGGKKSPDAGGLDGDVVKSTTGTNADVYHTIIYGKHFFTRIPLNAMSYRFYRKPLGSAGALDPIDQIQTMGWKRAGARLITGATWGVRLESAASV
ncbi:MAG: N4-gp56 family major capsid protein [Nitrospira sp. WS110]|nr:N4-gp56 family major capsid protein [Nitrospira sp. WS110]